MLPLGIASPVTAGGANLSSGTRQLVALARVLLEGRPLVAVDEAAACVDEGSETHIVDTLAALPPHVTVLVVAHRQASVDGLPGQLLLRGGGLLKHSDVDVNSHSQ